MRRGAALPTLLFLVAWCQGHPVAAEEMLRSPVPPPNPLYLSPAIAVPDAVPASVPAIAGEGLAVSLRPMPRPASIAAMVAAAGQDQGAGLDLEAAAAAAAPESDESAPKARKKDKAKERETASKKGSVCGVNAIKGEKIAPIKAKVKGCGLKDGVRVSSVSGVRLSPPVSVDCGTAKALNTWVAKVAQPAFGGDLVELKIFASYACRPRNNVKGAKISEHGRGKAVDVGGFVLSSGKTLSVAHDYGKLIRKVHRGGCGIFGTTLGPGSDGYHEDHLHFDTASYRGGPYCR